MDNWLIFQYYLYRDYTEKRVLTASTGVGPRG